jgi:hypothetical protein
MQFGHEQLGVLRVSIQYVAVWYSLGIGLAGTLGAMLGPLVRW